VLGDGLREKDDADADGLRENEDADGLREKEEEDADGEAEGEDQGEADAEGEYGPRVSALVMKKITSPDTNATASKPRAKLISYNRII
jgi:hypothetical protein